MSDAVSSSRALRAAVPHPGWRSLAAVIGVVGALVAYRGLLYFEPSAGLRQTVQGAEAWFFASYGQSPLLIYGLTAWLVIARVRRFRRAAGVPSSWTVAGLLFAPAAGLFVWGHYTNAPDLLVPSLSLAMLGVGWLAGGARGLRILIFPAVFLLLVAPIPPVLLNAIFYPLQLETSRVAVWILNSIGVDSLLNADRILTGGKIFQVIETCSGLRSMGTLLMAALLYVEIFYRNRLQAFVIVASAPLLGLIVNVARVLSIVLNPYAELSSVHTLQGIAMLVAGVLLLAVVDRVVLRFHPLAEARPSMRRGPAPEGPVATSRVVLLLALTAALCAVSFWMPRFEPQRSGLRQIATLAPRFEPDWQAKGLPIDREYLGTVHFTEWVHRRYSRPESAEVSNSGASSPTPSVDVLIVTDERLERASSALSDKVAVLGSGWEVIRREPVRLDPEGLEMELLVERSISEAALVLHWTIGASGIVAETTRAALALDQSPFRRTGRLMIVRLSTSVDRSDPNAVMARARLEEMARNVIAELERIDQPA